MRNILVDRAWNAAWLALTAQRIHDTNAGTMRTDKTAAESEAASAHARELRLNFPMASRLSDKVFSKAVADYLRSGQRDVMCDSTIWFYLKRCGRSTSSNIVLEPFFISFRAWGRQANEKPQTWDKVGFNARLSLAPNVRRPRWSLSDVLLYLLLLSPLVMVAANFGSGRLAGNPQLA